MTLEHIQELLEKDPFEPFVIKLTNSDVHVVQTPHAVALMGTRIFVAFPNGKWVFIPLAHIASVESLQAA
jgi:hypothetical protein